MCGPQLDLFETEVAEPAVEAEPDLEAVETLDEPDADRNDDDVEVRFAVDAPAPLSLFGDLPRPERVAPVRLLSVYVHFETRDDLEDFARLIGQPVTSETSRIWYPADVAFTGARWEAAA